MRRPFRFTTLHRDQKTLARTGVIHTPHGAIETPAFVPVGTQGTVKSLTPDELTALGVELFFVNTYHMYLRPGMDVIRKCGGLHRFMGWDKPLITDSGGFQVFSLSRRPLKGPTLQGGDKEDQADRSAQLVTVTDDGVEFQSHWDGSSHLFTPEKSMELQWQLGADIHIAFDDCTPYPVTHEEAKKSMERTHRWAVRSLDAHQRLSWKSQKTALGKTRSTDTTFYQALYGVVQGSVYEDLRKESARFIGSMDVDGIAIGGVSVGESKKDMADAVRWVMPIIPENKPRHLLGVGEIDDIFMLVEQGIDTFDCVQPTRLARMGAVFMRNDPIATASSKPIRKHMIDITKQSFAQDITPIDKTCPCYTCTHVSRAYLHHLFRVRELLAYRLATIHNIHFVNRLVGDIRNAIQANGLLELKKQWV